MMDLQAVLAESAGHHRHLCPRQVLGARMGLLGAELLELALPRGDKRLLVFIETDGCAVDGVSAATGCTVGHRTLRVVDLGKVAATLVDTRTERAIRIVPRRSSRAQAGEFAPEARSRWHAQLLGYQRMPDALLLRWHAVTLATPLRDLISRPSARAICQACGEEVLNQREVVLEGHTLCRACAYPTYYRSLHTAGLTLSGRQEQPSHVLHSS